DALQSNAKRKRVRIRSALLCNALNVMMKKIIMMHCKAMPSVSECALARGIIMPRASAHSLTLGIALQCFKCDDEKNHYDALQSNAERKRVRACARHYNDKIIHFLKNKIVFVTNLKVALK